MRASAPDYVIFYTVLILLGIGVIMVYSASAISAGVSFNDSYYFLKRQLIWVVVGLTAMIVTMHVNYHVWLKLAKPIILITIILLCLVLVPGLGKVVNGARRWLGSGSLYLQPSEVAKVSMVIFMSYYLAKYHQQVKSFRKGIVPALMMLGVVFGLILKEPDLGTALSVAGTVFILLFVAGAKVSHLFGIGITGVCGIVVAILAEPYRLKRLIAFHDPWADPLNTGYHIIQSLYALGSGGIFGVGLGRSREKFLYLPEPHTDFIFSIIGEELGLIGTMTVIFLFFLFAWRGLKVAMLANDMSGSFLATGITIMILLQAVMNMAVVTASMPVTGIPLPFLSFGGSALIFTLASVGILLNISRYMNVK